MKRYSIFGVGFDALSESAARERIKELVKKERTSMIFTPNAQILERVRTSKELVGIFNSADLLLADGCGISLAMRLSKGLRVRRVTGIDTGFWLMQYAAQNGLRVFFLGARPGVAERAASRLQKEIPALCICGVHHGYFEPCENERITSLISKARADIVFVCLGSPAQEKWISENAKSLPNVRILMGLGGSLDVWSGDVSRAPKVMQRMGLEWLYRCMCQPKRLRELVLLPRFLLHTLVNRSNFFKTP